MDKTTAHDVASTSFHSWVEIFRWSGFKSFLREAADVYKLTLILQERRTGFLMRRYDFAVFGPAEGVEWFQRMVRLNLERYNALP